MMMTMLAKQIEEGGYAIIAKCLDERLLHAVELHLNGRQAGLRNLLGISAVRELASSRRFGDSSNPPWVRAPLPSAASSSTNCRVRTGELRGIRTA
jgi:hypothetical protein